MRGGSVFECVEIDRVVHVEQSLGFGVDLTTCSREREGECERRFFFFCLLFFVLGLGLVFVGGAAFADVEWVVGIYEEGESCGA